MATRMASCLCFVRSTPRRVMSTKVAINGPAHLRSIWNHGTPTSLNLLTSAKTTAKRRLELVIYSTRCGYPTSCEPSFIKPPFLIPLIVFKA